MKELEFINTIQQTLGEKGSLIGDDTAFIEEKDLLITQDSMAEGVHFRMDTITPFELGYKSCAASLSDIASMGGVADYLLISLSLPCHIDNNFIKEFYKGVNELATRYNVKIAGGDITGSDKIFVSTTALGSMKGYQPLLRLNAQVGDIVAVSGYFGSSKAGFELLEKGIEHSLTKNHTMPEPRLKLGREVATKTKNSAGMDSSDGLADCLYKISLASNVGMKIHTIPYNKELEKFTDNPTNWALFGGEDYELVFCIREKDFEKFPNLIPIGKVVRENEIIIKAKGKEFKLTKESFEKGSFDHFHI